MAKRCDICGKGPQTGNVVSHSNNKTKTRNYPNLRAVRADIPGRSKRLLVCTRCLRSNKVKKAA